jgi:hypothetical protein
MTKPPICNLVATMRVRSTVGAADIMVNTEYDFLLQCSCNYLQLGRVLTGLGITAALGAIAADFYSCHHDMKAALTLNLAFETIE